MATKTFKIGLSNTDKQNMAQEVYERLLALTFPEYDTTETYSVGDFVVYNDQLYKCIGSTTGAWDSTKWQLATLNDLLTDIESAVAFVNDKANVDGNYPTMTVGVADQLSPYDDESGDDQDEPFILQATGTGNGSQPDFSTGSYALMKEKQGNTVALNQLISNPTFTSSTGWTSIANSTISVSNNELTTTDNGASGSFSVGTNNNSLPTSILGHKVLVMFDVILVNTDKYQSFRIRYPKASDYISGINATNWTKIAVILNLTSVEQYRFGLQFSKTESVTSTTSIKIRNAYLIDLTQWFNGDIPQDLLDNPSNFFRYYKGSLAYNAGELVNADGRYIKCIGMNQFDGINDVKAIPNATYYINGSATLTYKDKDENTISSESKTNETFVAPSNCLSIGVSGSGNISINLYYEDEARCLTYEPYEVLTNNDTGEETLRSAGSVKDYKTPDGIIHRLVGSVDLGTLSWDYDSTSQTFRASMSGGKINSNDNMICSKYIVSSSRKSTSTPPSNGEIAQYGRNDVFQVILKDSSLQSTDTPSGTLYYELATPTTEQGTPYSENLVIDDFGSMSWDSDVPQGNLIFYPVDYKAFIDTLYNYTEGTPSNLALNSELNAKFETYLKSLSGYDGSATQVLKNVEGTLTWVTEE